MAKNKRFAIAFKAEVVLEAHSGEGLQAAL